MNEGRGTGGQGGEVQRPCVDQHNFFLGQLLNPPSSSLPRGVGGLTANLEEWHTYLSSSLPGKRSFQADVVSLAAQFCASAAAQGELEHFMDVVIQSAAAAAGTTLSPSSFLSFMNPANQSFPIFEVRAHAFEKIIEKMSRKRVRALTRKDMRRQCWDAPYGGGSANTCLDYVLRRSFIHCRHTFDSSSNSSISRGSLPDAVRQGDKRTPTSTLPPWFEHFVCERASFVAGDENLLEPPLTLNEVDSAVLTPSCLQIASMRAINKVIAVNTITSAESSVDDQLFAVAPHLKRKKIAYTSPQTINARSPLLEAGGGHSNRIAHDCDGIPAQKKQRRSGARTLPSFGDVAGAPENLIILPVQFPDPRQGGSEYTSSRIEIDLLRVQTVGDLKANILGDMTGLPVGKIKVWHPLHGFLKDREWLKSYQLHSGGSLRVEVKARGGGKPRHQ